MKNIKRKIMAGLVLSAGLILSGCSVVIPSSIEYANADEAKEALNHASTVTLRIEDLENANVRGDILADEKNAGYLSENGFINPKKGICVR